MVTRVFQIACVNTIPNSMRKNLFFTYDTQNIITYTLWNLLVDVAKHGGGKNTFIPGPSWFLGPGSLQPYDVVVYFVQSPERSITRLAGAPTPQSSDGNPLGGFTASSPHGVVCEVYVEWGLPAEKLAKVAFHEIMHNKLDVGGRVIGNLHTEAGGMLATPPTNERKQLSNLSKKLMSANLFRPVRQYTAAMNS